MSELKTLAALRLECQQRAGMEENQYITDGEWTTLINSSLKELYGILILKYGDDYYLSETTATTTGLADTVTLPADFLKLRGVDASLGGSDRYIEIRPFVWADRNRGSSGELAGSVADLRYRLKGADLLFTPRPMAGIALRIFYIPRAVELVDEDDTTDGYNGWLEFVVIDCAIKALQKEESDVRVFLAQKAAIIARIQAEAANRDAGAPQSIGATRANGGGVGDEWWG